MTKMMKKVMVMMVMLVAVFAISAVPAQAATRTTKLQLNVKQTKMLKFTRKKLPKKAKVSWTSSNKNVVAVKQKRQDYCKTSWNSKDYSKI